MPGGIGRETGDTDSLGYFSQSDVATVRYPSDNIGNDKFVLRVFGILEKESIGIPFVRVSPPFIISRISGVSTALISRIWLDVCDVLERTKQISPSTMFPYRKKSISLKLIPLHR